MPLPAPSQAASVAGHLPADQLHHLHARPSPAPQHLRVPLSPCPAPAPVRRASWLAGIWSRSPSATAAGYLRPLDPPGGGRPPPPHPARIALSFLQLSPRRARSPQGAPPPAMEAARAESTGRHPPPPVRRPPRPAPLPSSSRRPPVVGGGDGNFVVISGKMRGQFGTSGGMQGTEPGGYKFRLRARVWALESAKPGGSSREAVFHEPLAGLLASCAERSG
jgi:hypothetical protein